MRFFFIVMLVLSGLLCHSQRSLRFDPIVPLNFQNPMMPLMILEHFARHCPDAIPFWSIDGKNYKLRYIDPATALGHAVIYDSHGTILRQENEIPFNDCPPSLQAYYMENYPNEQLRIWTYEEGKELQYFLTRGSKTVWFDKEGRFLRKRSF